VSRAPVEQVALKEDIIHWREGQKEAPSKPSRLNEAGEPVVS
jgi:hypothetical protein